MPIEAYLLSSGSTEPFHFATVPPGEVGVFQDKSLKAGTYIVARCQEDDMSGNIHIVETNTEVAAESIDGEEVQIGVKLSPDNLAKTIQSAVDFEKEIIDSDGEKGTLIFQHEAGFAQTISGIFHLD